MMTVYALIWRSTEPDATWKQEEFDARIPRLMDWLRRLHAAGRLFACGGGGFETHAGGLTLIQAEDLEQARELASGSPMNEIGSTEIFVWDVYFAKLAELSNEGRLRPA